MNFNGFVDRVEGFLVGLNYQLHFQRRVAGTEIEDERQRNASWFADTKLDQWVPLFALLEIN